MEKRCTESDRHGQQPGTKDDVAHTMQCASIISCHRVTLSMILLINAKRAKAFIECPGLVGHIEASVASWLVLRQKRKVMANNYCNIIK